MKYKERADEAARRSGGRWFEGLRLLCKQACLAGKSRYNVDAVLFYLARWCQKASGEVEPDLRCEDSAQLRQAVDKIVRNLTEDGPLVERLVEGDDVEAWTNLRRLLLASARRMGGERAGDFADDALQRIAEVLLTGTPPSQAAEQLRLGPDGPRNEYIFASPFSFWARAVVINLIIDELRRVAREREGILLRGPKTEPPLDRALLERAGDALPSLLAAIRELPPVQRSVMVLSLSRRDLDELLLSRLHELAPDLFSDETDKLVGNDRDIAERLGTTARLVAANRSVARRKLARRDPLWALLLDVLLPHRTTRPLAVPSSSEPENA